MHTYAKRASTTARRVGFGLVVLVFAACNSDTFTGDAGGADGGDGGVVHGNGGDGGGDGGSGLTCDAGLTACGSVCIDLGNDPKNCGKCGHDCLGAACSAGLCQPVNLFTGTTGTGGRAIAVDANNIYWAGGSSGRAVNKCAIGGCNNAPTVLADNILGLNAVAVDATTVYWQSVGDGQFTFGGIWKCAIAGCNSTPTAIFNGSSPWGPEGLAIDTSNAYWSAQGLVERCPLSGCPGAPFGPASLAPQSATSVVTDKTNLYWMSDSAGGVERCPLPNCNPISPVSAAQAHLDPSQIALDATNAYWINPGTCPSDGGACGGSIAACPLGASCTSPTILASGLDTPFHIAADNAHVYWTTATAAGSVMRCAITGCNNKPEILVTGQSYPAGLALDATRVYWTTSDAVRWVAK